MSLNKFCPKCGATKGEFIKGFCKNCYLRDHKIIDVPNEMEVEHCKSCNAVRLKGKWVMQSEGAIKKFVEGKVRAKEINNPEIFVDLNPLEDGRTEAMVTVKGLIESKPIIVKKSILLKPKTNLCDPCMKLISNYHEAIVQFRYDKKPDERDVGEKLGLIEEMLKKQRNKDSLAGIVNSTVLQKGFDVCIGSKRAGKLVAEYFANKYGTKITYSSKLTGVDKMGKEKYRYTFCVRVRASV